MPFVCAVHEANVFAHVAVTSLRMALGTNARRSRIRHRVVKVTLNVGISDVKCHTVEVDQGLGGPTSP
jgi:hypothetical protein